jgi:hypothetical protein
MIRYDRSYLPPAELEFVVIADTHHIVDPGMYRTKGDSVTPDLVRDWAGRGDVALAFAKALEPVLAFHVGDLQQEYPGHESFDTGRRAAIRQLEDAGLPLHMAAGNMDIGDKSDPTMPASWVDPAYLAVWHEDFGPSHFSVDEGAFHFVVLNSQVMNSELEEGRAQREWLEADLRDHEGQRIMLFFHIPPFLVDEDEPGLGSYDVLDEPDRSWLLELVRRYRIEAVFCGHTHFQTFNGIDAGRLYTLPSTTTTRPGFYESISVEPPMRGWADTPKLGFFLVRALPDGLAVHLVRTSGRSEMPTSDRAVVLTAVTRELPHSPLGTYLRLPLARHSDGAIAYPYQVRHRIRDDYPLLACLELGLRHVRFPLADLESPIQRERLALLRAEGVALTGTAITAPGRDAGDLSGWADDIDVLEIQLAGHTLPTQDQLSQVEVANGSMAISLCPIVMESSGTVHKRSRNGYRATELAMLDALLDAHGLHIHHAVCHVDAADDSAWNAVLAFPREGLRAVGGLDFMVSLGGEDEPDAEALAESILAASTLPGSRLFIDPLQELDRTASIMNGLLDRLSNPAPMFHVVRVLNSVLFGSPDGRPDYRADDLIWQDAKVARGVVSERQEHWLVTPSSLHAAVAALGERHATGRKAMFIDLLAAESRGPIARLSEEPEGWMDSLGIVSVTLAGS